MAAANKANRGLGMSCSREVCAAFLLSCGGMGARGWGQGDGGKGMVWYDGGEGMEGWCGVMVGRDGEMV